MGSEDPDGKNRLVAMHRYEFVILLRAQNTCAHHRLDETADGGGGAAATGSSREAGACTCHTTTCHHHHNDKHFFKQEVYHNPDNFKRSLLNRVRSCGGGGLNRFALKQRLVAGDCRQQRQPRSARHGGQAEEIPYFLQIL
jgi:hypothetical protein